MLLTPEEGSSLEGRDQLYQVTGGTTGTIVNAADTLQSCDSHVTTVWLYMYIMKRGIPLSLHRLALC